MPPPYSLYALSLYDLFFITGGRTVIQDERRMDDSKYNIGNIWRHEMVYEGIPISPNLS